jgi:RNA polymerase sigma-70 factor (ECF subfamily)
MLLEKYKSLKDEEIIAAILNQQKNNLFEVLYERYKRKVLDKCFSLLKNKEIAEESVQHIFEKTFEKLRSFKGNASFSSWLYSITYNHCIDYLRTQKKIHYPDWNKNNELPEIVEETDENPDEINYDRLIKILDLIHPEEKALLLMKYSDNLSIIQIAKALRITESATKMRLKRAKARVLYLYTKTYSELN